MPADKSTHRSGPNWAFTGWALVLMLALILLRTLYLDADTPLWVWSDSAAAHVDEGYKTLDARNLYLFGSAHWNDADDYPGWSKRSPVTQEVFLLAFRALGQDLESARLVTVAWFALLLIAFSWSVINREGDPKLHVAGLLLLGLNGTLFMFSRLALFEVPITVCVYLAVFVLKRISPTRSGLAAGLVLGLMLFSTFGIKASALIAFIPIVVALGVYHLWRLKGAPPKLLVLVLLVMVTTGTFVLFKDLAFERVDELSVSILRHWLANPIAHALPLLVGSSFLAVGHALSVDWRRFLGAPDRVALLGLAVIGPLVLSFLSYHPLRYYVPLIPAYPLLVLEWGSMGSWKKKSDPSLLPPWVSAAVALFYGWAVICFGLALNRFVLSPLFPDSAAQPNFIGPVEFKFLFLGGGVATVALWSGRTSPQLSRLAPLLLVGALALSLAQDLKSNATLLLHPTYERRDIARSIEEAVPPGQTVGGDWAPLFALGSNLRVLYLTWNFNPPQRILEVKPDYILYSETTAMDGILEFLDSEPGVVLEMPVYESRFIGRRIALYPLRYESTAGPPPDS